MQINSLTYIFDINFKEYFENDKNSTKANTTTYVYCKSLVWNLKYFNRISERCFRYTELYKFLRFFFKKTPGENEVNAF